MNRVMSIILSPWMGVFISGLVFLALVGMRLDFFSSSTPMQLTPEPITRSKESWMGIYQNERRIGFSHRRIKVLADGYEMNDNTHMRINTMGLSQNLSLSTIAELNHDFSLKNFTFDTRSNLFGLSITGYSAENTLHLNINNRSIKIPLKKPIYLTANIFESIARSDIQPGTSRKILILDPTSVSPQTVKVTSHGNETIQIYDKLYTTNKYTLTFKGSSQLAWIDETGEVVQEKSLMGISLKKISADEATDSKSLSISEDLTKAVAVDVQVPIHDTERIKMIRIELSGVEKLKDIDGGRQKKTGNTLTIERESLHGMDKLPRRERQKLLAPEIFIQSDHPEITRIVNSIIGKDDKPHIKARKIMSWIHNNIQKRPVLSIPSALETLRQRMGDCNEHAVLMAALMRAAGIPTKLEAGLVYLKGKFYYHAWNLLYLGHWVTADALMNQMPADVTHIRLVQGHSEAQSDLLGVIGKIQLKVLELLR